MATVYVIVGCIILTFGLVLIFLLPSLNKSKATIKVPLLGMEIKNATTGITLIVVGLVFLLKIWPNQTEHTYSIKGTIVNKYNAPLKGVAVTIAYNHGSATETKTTGSTGGFYFAKDTDSNFEALIRYQFKKFKDSDQAIFNVEPYTSTNFKLDTSIPRKVSQRKLQIISNLTSSIDLLISQKLNLPINLSSRNKLHITLTYPADKYHDDIHGDAKYDGGGKVQLIIPGCKTFSIGNEDLIYVPEYLPQQVKDSLQAQITNIVRNHIPEICSDIRLCM